MAGQVYDFQAAGPVLKQKYESKPVENGFLQDHTLLADVAKEENASGAAFQIDVKSAFTSTRNVSVGGALSNGAPDQYVAFNVLNIYKDFVLALLSGEAVDAVQEDEGGMIDLLSESIDGAKESGYESQAQWLHSNGGGMRGQVSNSSYATSICTLTNVGDTLKFWQGQVIQASVANDDGAGGLGVAVTQPLPGTLTVYGVDYQAGTVTFTTNMATGIPLLVQNSGLFAVNDYAQGFLGLAAWNPVTAPSTVANGGTLFLNVDRGRNVVGLAGWRFTGGGSPYENTITKALARMSQFRAQPSDGYMNHIDWAQFANTQNAKVIIDKGKTPAVSNADLSFETLTVMGPKGAVRIKPDVNVVQGTMRLVNHKTLYLKSNGKLVRPVRNWIGSMWLPSWTDDILQARFVTRSFLVSRRPMDLGIITF